ncbi:MAG: 4'-phosphopantetheinyl transferase superfamily protein [Prevotellaceae bacterium]|jgi:phosphopantetheinyl transferase|nr:4'-phosphopantetheinyl transferase superfamily protein [Prevotellaceae bacterium]
MLLWHHTNNDGSRIAVAEIPDGEVTPPCNFFSEQEEQEYRQLGSAKRIRERAATLHLLHSLLGVEDALHHRSNGKPYLSAGSYRISISHTRRQVAVALHPCREAGVDVEDMSRSFAKAAPRYLSAGELAGCATPAQQCVAWCAKEAVYKLAGEEGVDFAECIRLTRFDVGEEGSIAAIFAGKTRTSSFTVRYRIIGEAAVAYAFA